MGLVLAMLFVFGFVVSKIPFQWIGSYVNKIHTSEKVIAITYDDGPHPEYTKKIADLFLDHKGKTTFFVVGNRLERHPQTALYVFNQGHEILNHSFSHPRLVMKPYSFVEGEISKTDQAMKRVGLPIKPLFRAPMGQKLFVLPYVLWKMGKTNVLGSVSAGDFAGPPPEKIIHNVMSRAHPGAIVVMHDYGMQPRNTYLASIKILELLSKSGYRFLTVSELLSQ